MYPKTMYAVLQREWTRRQGVVKVIVAIGQ